MALLDLWAGFAPGHMGSVAVEASPGPANGQLWTVVAVITLRCATAALGGTGAMGSNVLKGEATKALPGLNVWLEDLAVHRLAFPANAVRQRVVGIPGGEELNLVGCHGFLLRASGHGHDWAELGVVVRWVLALEALYPFRLVESTHRVGTDGEC